MNFFSAKLLLNYSPIGLSEVYEANYFASPPISWPATATSTLLARGLQPKPEVVGAGKRISEVSLAHRVTTILATTTSGAVSRNGVISLTCGPIRSHNRSALRRIPRGDALLRARVMPFRTKRRHAAVEPYRTGNPPGAACPGAIARINSTRRFAARPSAESLLASGRVWA